MHIREVRLGLVLYGGVSLAIYENGITAGDLSVDLRRWSVCVDCELIDSDVVVDVISGTWLVE